MSRLVVLLLGVLKRQYTGFKQNKTSFMVLIQLIGKIYFPWIIRIFRKWIDTFEQTVV